MVWGNKAASGVDDLAKRLQANDPLLRSLTILRFRRLNDGDIAQLSTATQDNLVLQELICCSHAISTKAAAMLGRMLQQNRCLKHISIGNSTLGDEALAALVSGGLHQNKNLRVWDLEHKGLSHASAASVSQVLQQHPTLQQLQLSRNNLADAGLRQLCADCWSALTHLDLAACDLTHQGVSSLAVAPSIGQLQQLDLSHNALGPAAASGLAQLLENATQLQTLNLKSTKLEDEGVKGIATGLQHAAPITVLDLSSNQLSSEGVAALAAALTQRPGGTAMQQLVLAGNPAVDDEAIYKLADSFKAPETAVPATDTAAGAAVQNQGQQEAHTEQQAAEPKQQLLLDLAHSGVGAEGIAALSQVAGLTNLSLFGCRLGGDSGGACTAVVDAIASGGFASLRELSLTGCGLSLPQLCTIMHAIGAGGHSLPELVTLELGANSGVQEEGFEVVVAALRAARPGLDVHWRVADSDEAPEPLA